MRYIWLPRSCFAAYLPSQNRSWPRASVVARLVRRASPSQCAASFCSARPPTIMAAVDTTARLAQLRTLMRERKVDVYVIPTDDSHASEYIADCDARREFISGFNGSAGTAVVTLDKAALATDGRYFNQAAKQLDQNWLLLKIGLQDVPSWEEWTAEQAAGGKTVGVDATLISNVTAEKLADGVKNAGGAGLKAVDENLVDLVWGAARPSRPSEPVVLLPERYAGRDARSKIADLRKELVKRKAYGFVLSSLDEIAWLFNLRGSDIAFNPVFFSYAIVTTDWATIYTDSSRLTPECQAYLSKNDIVVKPYGSLLGDTKSLAKEGQMNGQAKSTKRFLISNKASWALKLSLGGEGLVDGIRSPVGDAKAVKTEAELEGMRQCHIRDGAALTEFFAWLENELVTEKATLDEVAAATKLEKLRQKQKDYVGLSFTTISATGPNAAVIHYKPEPGLCSIVDPNAVYLCDSGAQYIDGTTDTTRTLHFGNPTETEKSAFTLVLKGHIALDRAVFPKGTTGYALDTLARQFLWREGLDYRHGTGHGVGSYLNVHEGPFGIGTRKAYVDVPMAVGNVTSIEPGYYEDGAYGIRLENIALVQEMKTKHMFGDKPYLGFEHVTMVPFCRNLLDTALLTKAEKDWLNDYHAVVFEKTSGFFQDDPHTLAWLRRETLPI